MTIPAEGWEPPRYAAPGVMVAGRYLLSRRIAGGGMGEVWRGHDRVLDEPVAIKLLRTEYLEEPAFLARFRSEARLAGLLNHPGIAAVRDYGEHDGPARSAWLVMELVEGEPLSRVLSRLGALPPEQALDVLGQAAVALQAAHDAGVVHRDVKPGNLLVRPDGVVKVTDFGIARAIGSAPLTRTGTVLGTAHYLSPEQVRGGSATPASDIYALGVVGYECLTGRRPFDGDSAVEVALAHQRDEVPPLGDHLPAPVVALVLRALAKEPSRRPASAGNLGRTALGIRAALYLESDDGAAPSTAHPLAGRVDVPAAVLDRPPAAVKPAVGPAGTAPGSGPQSGAERTARPAASLVRSRLLLVVLVALVLAVVVAALVRASAGPGSTDRAPTPAPAVAANPGIALDPASFRGKPAALVFAALVAKGLLGVRVDVGAQGAPGTVVTLLGASGGPLPATLHRGDTVDVQVVATASEPGATP